MSWVTVLLSSPQLSAGIQSLLSGPCTRDTLETVSLDSRLKISGMTQEKRACPRLDPRLPLRGGKSEHRQE